MDQKKYKVIIVGGGVAGLAAARTFGQLGIDGVLLLEAKKKLGGRILTCELGSGSGLVELGAQWIHGQDSELYELAKHAGNVHDERSVEGQGEFRTCTGEIISSETARHVINTVQEHLRYIEEEYDVNMYQARGQADEANSTSSNHGKQSVSVGSYLQEMYEKEKALDTELSEHDKAIKAALWDWKINFERIDNSCDELTQLSLYRWGEFLDCSGKPYNNFRFGAQAFVDSLSRTPPANRAEIKVSCPVTKINWSSNSNVKSLITVTYVDQASGGQGQVINVQASAILVTMSIGVLKSALTPEADLFHPPLPKKFASIIEAFGFGSITKVFLEWETPWWKNGEFAGLQLVWPRDTDCPVKAMPKWVQSLQGFDRVVDNRNVLMSWASGEGAVSLESLDPEEIGKQCTLALRQFMNNDKIPMPKQTMVSNWFHDPFTCGAYSYRSTETDQFLGDLTQVLNEPIHEEESVPNEINQSMFLLAGEALHPTQYSTLHGAFDSGKRQAHKIANYLKSDI